MYHLDNGHTNLLYSLEMINGVCVYVCVCVCVCVIIPSEGGRVQALQIKIT